MTYLFILLPILVLFILWRVGTLRASMKFGEEVRQLFSLSLSVPGSVFSHKQLAGLPPPVQRYFQHVLREGMPIIRYVRLMHDGKFKTGIKKDWVNIKGEEYFTTATPAFVWKGITNSFTALDAYVGGKGRLVVWLFSLFRVVNAQGKKIDQGELARWLGECIWFPTALLPGENIQWQSVDDHTATLIYTGEGQYLEYIVTFNDQDEISLMQTERYMNDRLEQWVVACREYRTISGVVIPTTAEVTWKLQEGDFSYALFHINKIEYNIPHRFN